MSPSLEFMPVGSSPAELKQAAAANHAEWFAANALASGGEVCSTDGVRWTITPQEAIIAFPRLSPRDTNETLDAIIAECYRRKVSKASCWSLSPTRPRDLGARIAARGFEWGWRPHWMALPLQHIIADCAVPDGLTITIEDTFADPVTDLPYYNPADAGNLHALAQSDPPLPPPHRRFYRFVARLNGAAVGQTVLFLTDGALGVGGIYNVGVVPSARLQGIGSAVSLAACRFAGEMGCHYALLNSAADDLYRSIGFVSLGYGQTWWMHAPTLAAPPPSPAQIAFAEAVGRGDCAALNALDPATLPADFNAPLTNGMTPMALAVQGRHSAAADWLQARGAMLSLLHAWDLGDKARARRLRDTFPERVNHRTGDRQITPLHEAVWRNDTALARFLLAANPDLTLEDTEYHSTPPGWARHLNRPKIVALIERHQATREK